MTALKIKAADIDLSEDGITKVKSAELATKLLHSKGNSSKNDPMALLRMASPTLDLSSVSINEAGNVVISDEKLQQTLKSINDSLTEDELTLGNNLCGWGCDDQ